MKIAIGCDQNGFYLKTNLIDYLRDLGHEPGDFGTFSADETVDYPDVGLKVAEAIRDGKYQRGVLICGTGIGMAITANKVPGVFAACCHDPYSAERARKSNDAQILTLGAQIVAPTLARVLLDHWLASEFAGGRSARKVEKMRAIDRKYNLQ
jgi:ribose 5-phosphate isomerase B